VSLSGNGASREECPASESLSPRHVRGSSVTRQLGHAESTDASRHPGPNLCPFLRSADDTNGAQSTTFDRLLWMSVPKAITGYWPSLSHTSLKSCHHGGRYLSMAICAYCEREASKLTKEHLWPAALHKRINESNRSVFNEDNRFYLSKIDRMIDGEPQIRDVCADCNNGPLSALDNYICELWDDYFHRIVPADAQIAFAFDYERLTRWLLKMSFNSARIHESDVKQLQRCREYILHGGSHPPHVAVHVQLTAPSELTAEHLAVYCSHGLDDTEYEPRHNRVGHFAYCTRFGYQRLMRAVHLQSFMFLIHLFPENVDQERRSAELRDLARRLPYSRRLRPRSGISNTTLICAGFDALTSMLAHLENNETIQADRRLKSASKKSR
jgi:hypothetical protein